MPKKSRKAEIKGNIGAKKKHPGNTPLAAPTTRPEARKEANAGARAEYAPVIRDRKANIRASRAREKEVGGWFNTLGGQITEAAAATDASYGQANAAMKANIDAATAAAQQNQGNVAAQDAQFAALTGADPGSFSKTAQTMNAGADQRAITGAALAAPIAAAGAGQAAYLRNTGINTRREGIQQRLTEGKRRQQIKQELLAARKERAQKAQADFGQMREAATDRALEKWKVNKAFPLEQKAAQVDAADTAHDNALGDRNAATAEKNANSTAYNAHHESGAGGLTPSQRRDARREQHNAMTAAKTLYNAAGRPAWGNKEWTLFVQRVAMEDGIDYTAAKRAVSRLRAQVSKQGGGGGGGPVSATDANPHGR